MIGVMNIFGISNLAKKTYDPERMEYKPNKTS
jgi:hypothetical protein